MLKIPAVQLRAVLGLEVSLFLSYVANGGRIGDRLDIRVKQHFVIQRISLGGWYPRLSLAQAHEQEQDLE